MKKQQPDWSSIFNYLKHTVGKEIARQKKSLIVALLFTLIFFSSFFWENLDRSEHLEFPLQKNQSYACLLHRIIDGDTIVADCDASQKQRINIRIWGMDAPEMKQEPWGKNAKNALEKIFLMNKHDIITLKIRDIDQYNRYVGQIFINNQEIDIGLKMVSDGFAVVYRQYNQDQQYQAEENHARNAKKGIWQYEGSQQDPASWRKVNPF